MGFCSLRVAVLVVFVRAWVGLQTGRISKGSAGPGRLQIEARSLITARAYLQDVQLPNIQPDRNTEADITSVLFLRLCHKASLCYVRGGPCVVWDTVVFSISDERIRAMIETFEVLPFFFAGTDGFTVQSKRKSALMIALVDVADAQTPSWRRE